jgi:hypothetical protein
VWSGSVFPAGRVEEHLDLPVVEVNPVPVYLEGAAGSGGRARVFWVEEERLFTVYAERSESCLIAILDEEGKLMDVSTDLSEPPELVSSCECLVRLGNGEQKLTVRSSISDLHAGKDRWAKAVGPCLLYDFGDGRDHRVRLENLMHVEYQVIDEKQGIKDEAVFAGAKFDDRQVALLTKSLDELRFCCIPRFWGVNQFSEAADLEAISQRALPPGMSAMLSTDRPLDKAHLEFIGRQNSANIDE